MRGVKKANARMVTSAMLGAFKSDARTRSEFLELLKRPCETQSEATWLFFPSTRSKKV
jgi:hypothetical protein